MFSSWRFAEGGLSAARKCSGRASSRPYIAETRPAGTSFEVKSPPYRDSGAVQKKNGNNVRCGELKWWGSLLAIDRTIALVILQWRGGGSVPVGAGPAQFSYSVGLTALRACHAAGTTARRVVNRRPIDACMRRSEPIEYGVPVLGMGVHFM